MKILEKPQIDAKDEINIIFQKRQLLKILLCCGIFFNVDFTQLRDYIHTYFIALFTSYFQPNVLHIHIVVMTFWIRASAVCWGKIDKLIYEFSRKMILNPKSKETTQFAKYIEFDVSQKNVKRVFFHAKYDFFYDGFFFMTGFMKVEKRRIRPTKYKKNKVKKGLAR